MSCRRPTPKLVIPFIGFSLLLFVAIPLAANGENGLVDPQRKVVYGMDDRIDVYDETNPIRRQLAASTCGLVYSYQLRDNESGGFTLDTRPFRPNGLAPCDGERFADQPTAMWCSGVLVGPDLVATAAHCCGVNFAVRCNNPGSFLSDTSYVFGFSMLDVDTAEVELDADQVYWAVEVVGRHFVDKANDDLDVDYMVVRLDREVTAPGAVPLQVRRDGAPAIGTLLGVIGYPTGLPKKLSFGADTILARDLSTNFFEANLDTFMGNSGSPVFNAVTTVIEGLLAGGEDDYVSMGGCSAVNVLPDSTAGESVSKASSFATVVPAIPNGLGSLLFDAAVYGSGQELTLLLRDYGLSDETTFTVEVDSSGAADIEDVVLQGGASSPGVFVGSLMLTREASAGQDGWLTVQDESVITATYVDGDNGEGAAQTVTAQATVDATAPAILSVTTVSLDPGRRAVVEVVADEACRATIDWGSVCGAPDRATYSTEYATSHVVTLEGALCGVEQFYTVEIEDAGGNQDANDKSLVLRST